MRRPFLAAALVAAAAAPDAGARPYYSAAKSLHCAACHVNPSGGGMRRPTPDSPVTISDSLHIGSDFRASFSAKGGRRGPGNASTFLLDEMALYLAAEPAEDLRLVYSAEGNGQIREAYAFWESERFGPPVYLRGGRFWVPYGLQLDNADAISTPPYPRGTKFAPSTMIFSMAAGSDTGLEVGTHPKRGAFGGLSVTNGRSGGGADGSEPKAWTARAGYILERLAVGVTALRNHPTVSGSGNAVEERLGFFGWTSWGPLALLGSLDWGRNKLNEHPHTNTYSRAGYVELDGEILSEQLLGKLKYEIVNPNVASSANADQRITLGLEWFAASAYSIEAQFRILLESPSIANNKGILAGHVWF